MKKGLLKLGLKEAKIGTFVQELSAEDSARIRHGVEEAFGAKSGSPESGMQTYAWSRFHPSNRSWKDVEASIDIAVQSAGVSTDYCWLFEEEWRDESVFKIKTDAIPRFVKEGWYPSHDVYLCEEQLRWCLVLMHHDIILLYNAEKVSGVPAT